MSNIRLATNVLCTLLETESGQRIASASEEELRRRLTYFELTALHRAAPFLFPGFWAEHEELTAAQRLHRDAFLTDYRVQPWEPMLEGFVPFEPPQTGHDLHRPPSQAASPVDKSLGATSSGQPVPHVVAPAYPGRVELETSRTPEVTPASDIVPMDADQPTVEPSGTVSQQNVIEASAGESLLVLAPPGTGKTHVLIERIVHLLSHGRFSNPAREMLVLSFTRATVADVRRRLSERIGEAASDDLRYIAVSTFDAFATRVLVESGNDHLLHSLAVGDSESSYDARVRALAELLESAPHRNPVPEAVAALRYLVVDEIQDLVGPRARLVLAMIRHVYANDGDVLVLGDPAQAIYDYTGQSPDSRSFLAGLRDAVRYRGREVALGRFYRFADPAMEQLVRQLWEAVGRDGSAPDGEALRHILYGLGAPLKFAELPSLVRPDRGLAVLVRSNVQAHQVASWLEQNGIPCIHHAGDRGRHWPAGLARIFLRWKMDMMSRSQFNERYEKLKIEAGEEEARGTLHALEYSRVIDDDRIDVAQLRRIVATQPAPPSARRETGIIVSTVHRSKGLEYDTVLVLQPERADDSEELRILYVAATRARRKLRLLHLDPKVIRRARKAGKTGYWTQADAVYLNRTQDLDPDLLSDSLVRTTEPKELQSRLWDSMHSSGPTGPEVLLCMRERAGRQHFSIAVSGQSVVEDICLCSQALSRALFGQKGRATDIGGGVTGWRVPLDGLETVAFPTSDAEATEAFGEGGMALLPILSNPIRTKADARVDHGKN